MPALILDDANAITYRWTEPSANRPSVVFYNPLAGDLGMWEATIAPALREAGLGTLLWNYRGQKESPIGADVQITADQVNADAVRLLAHVAPPRPIHVGHLPLEAPDAVMDACLALAAQAARRP